MLDWLNNKATRKVRENLKGNPLGQNCIKNTTSQISKIYGDFFGEKENYLD